MYGIFICLFFATCYVQWEKFSQGQGVNRVMVTATVFFGFSTTIHWVLSVYRVIRAVFYTPAGMSIYQSLEPSYPIEEIVRWSVLELQIVVADIIMVYRMYHIYDRNHLLCIIPSITTAALFAVGCGVASQFRYAMSANQTSLINWSSAGFAIAMFNSIFLTGAISFRLWSVHRETQRANIHIGDSVVLRAMKVLIESAALCTVFIAMSFFSYIAKSDIMNVFTLITCPIVGISFCLIIVRFGNVLPEIRQETWHISVHASAPRVLDPEQIAVSFTRVKVQQDVYTAESTSSHTNTLEARKQGYVTSGDSPRINRSSLNLSTST